MEGLWETKRTMFFDWLPKTDEATVGYEDLKMLAQDRSSWRQHENQPWQNATAVRSRCLYSGGRVSDRGDDVIYAGAYKRLVRWDRISARLKAGTTTAKTSTLTIVSLYTAANVW